MSLASDTMRGDWKQREWFEDWRPPNKFFGAADDGLNTCFVSDKNPPQYLREAYIAGLLACIWQDDRGPCKVHLMPVKDQFPDARLKAGDDTLDLEVTMALGKGRRMFKEWRELRAKIVLGEIVPAETMAQRQASAREAIPRIVGKKAQKHYAQLSTLLVHTDDARALAPEEMAHLTEPWKNSFKAIFLLSGMDAVEVWPTLQVMRAKEPPWRR